jgi:hypothetical protein
MKKDPMMEAEIGRAITKLEIVREGFKSHLSSTSKAGFEDGAAFWAIEIVTLNEHLKALNKLLYQARGGDPTRVTKWVRTNEDWYPAMAPLQKPANPDYHNPLDHAAVRVSMMLLNDGNWRVCVWGGDDFGMEYDSPDFSEIKKLYDGIWDFTTKSDLQRRGFVHA